MIKVIQGKLIQYIKQGQILYWCSFFVLILVDFLLTGKLSKILNDQNYLVYVNVLTTIQFYNIIANLGLAYAILYITSFNPALKYKLFRQSIQLQTIWYVIFVSIHLLIFFCFRTSQAQEWVEALLITAVISYPYAYKQNINSLFLASRSYNSATFSNGLQKVALLCMFLAIGYFSGLKSFLNTHFLLFYPLVEVSVILLYLAAFYKTNYLAAIAPPINYKKRIFRYGKYAMLNNGLNVVYYTIMASIFTQSHLGIHEKIILALCISFFRNTGVSVAPVFSIVTPIFTSLKGDAAGIRKLYKKYFSLILGIGLFIMIVCRFFLSIIINGFFAAKYADLPIYFNFFAYLIPFLFINSLNSTVMLALGKIKYTSRVEVVSISLLGLFFLFSLLFPISNYVIFYYFIAAHLFIKFLLLFSGMYRLLKR